MAKYVKVGIPSDPAEANLLGYLTGCGDGILHALGFVRAAVSGESTIEEVEEKLKDAYRGKRRQYLSSLKESKTLPPFEEE